MNATKNLYERTDILLKYKNNFTKLLRYDNKDRKL